jgi:murein DD-endopeptidase MepM/ murein hydrolase activator NlpD
MRDIVVPKNTIPLLSQERNASLSVATKKQTATRFNAALSEATRQHGNRANKAAVPSQAPSSKSYTIQTGDTLSEIVATEAKKLGGNYSRRDLYTMVNQVAALNHLNNPNSIFPGQQLDLTSIGGPQSEPGLVPASGSVSEPEIAVSNLPVIPLKTTFQAPVRGEISSLFGMRKHPVLGENLHHDGIDIRQPLGTPVKPVGPGVVTFSGKDGGYGLMVEIDHGNGLTSRYAHLSKLLANKGERINPEQTLGQVGQTGLTTGPHLHLEIHRQNNPIDPLTVLNRRQIETDILVAGARTPHRI